MIPQKILPKRPANRGGFNNFSLKKPAHSAWMVSKNSVEGLEI